MSAFLLTEPDVGSDPARMRATATPTEDGKAYLVDGTKLWSTNGPIAELLVVMAKVPPHDGARGGISAFVVEADTPGITVEHRNGFMGLKGMENGVTHFHQVRVPVENRIGAEGAGLKIALTTLNTGRLSIPAICAGGSKWAVKIAREWSAERVQWGRPIGEHEAVGTKIAFIAATAFAMESVFEVSGSARRRGPEGRQDRSGAGQALDQRDGLSSRRRAGPGSWRPRLRDTRTLSRLVANVRCPPSSFCGTCGSTGSSRARRRSCGC